MSAVLPLLSKELKLSLLSHFLFLQKKKKREENKRFFVISFFGERVSFFFLHGGYKKKEEKFPSEDDLTGVGNKTLTIVDFYKGFMVHFQIPCNIKKAFCRKECTKCFLKQRGYHSYSRPECVMRHVNFLETIFLFNFSNI